MHIEVKELSKMVRSALENVNYGARDIKVEPAESVSLMVAGGKGMRGFVLVLNLTTGERKTVAGSWGGQNMFTDNPVDSTDEKIEIPEHGIVIKGTTGYPRTFATIYAHPNAVGAYLLPSGQSDDDTLTDVEQQAIYCFAAIKGGQYRRDEMRRRNVTDATVDALVERGYLKRSKNGATQITTKGKNARTVRY